MRVLIDTNILISALLKEGLPDVIVWMLAQAEFHVTKTQVVLC